MEVRDGTGNDVRVRRLMSEEERKECRECVLPRWEEVLIYLVTAYI